VNLPADSVELIRQWAVRTNAVQEVWLFGSRAKGTSRPDSDVDIGIYLTPHEWAFGIYVAKGDAWQRELAGLLGMPVSLEAVTPDLPGHSEVQAGKRLWVRS
jgi:predicted nucleotidyltransferase